MPNEYLEHLKGDDAMVSSTLSSVLREQTAAVLQDVKESVLAAKIVNENTQISAKNVQNIFITAEEGAVVSFVAGLKTTLLAQQLLNTPCTIKCGTIEKSNLLCVSWDVSKSSPTTFTVTLNFQNAL